MSKKKDHKKAVKQIAADRERIGDVLARVSMAYVDVYKRMHGEDATPEQMFAVSKAGMAFALAARVVKGDIELEFLHAPMPFTMQPITDPAAAPKDNEGDEGEGHIGMYL